MINIIQSFIEEKGLFLALNKIKDDFEANKMKKVFFIVPEQFTLEAEKIIIDHLTANGLFNIEVLSIKRLTNKILSNTISSYPKVIDINGKSMVIKHITTKLKEELECFNMVSNRYSFNENLCELFTELKKQDVSFDKLDNEKKDNFFYKKTNDIKKIYEEYNSFLKGANDEEIYDIEDLIYLAADKAKYATFLKDSQINYFGFDVFDKNTYHLINAFMDLSLEQTFIFNTGKDTNKNYATYSIVNNTIDIITKEAKKKSIPLTKKHNTDEHLKEDLDFLANNLFSFNNKKYLKDAKNITITKNDNIYDEVEYVAKEIVRLIRDEDVRFNDIMVLPSDFEMYCDIIKEVFIKNDINFFLDNTTNMNDTNVIRAIIKILDIVNYDFSTKDIISFLKTNLTPLTKNEIETLENYTVEFNIKHTMWIKEFTYNNEFNEYNLDKLNEDKDKVILPILNLRKELKDKNTVAEMTKVLYKFLKEYEIEEKIKKIKDKFEKNNDYLNANKYSQIYNKIILTLEQIYNFLGDIKMGLTEYTEILKYGFSAAKIGLLPESVDKVSILTLQRSRKTSIKYLFVMGVNDGKLPNAFNEGGIYTDREKHFAIENGINLRSTREYKKTEERYFLTTLIAKTKEHLYLTYSTHDKEGKEIIPSFIIKKILTFFNMKEKHINHSDDKDNLFLISNYKATFENLIVNLNKEKTSPFWMQVKNAYQDEQSGQRYITLLDDALKFRNEAKITSDTIKEKLENNSLKTSITQIETQASCPFKYFIRYVLKPKERKKSKIENIDMGNVVHEVINEFSQMIIDEKIDVKSVSEDKIKNISKELIDKKIEGFKAGKFKKQANSKFFKSKLLNETTLAFNQIIKQLKNSNFKLKASEVTFESINDKKNLLLPFDENKEIMLTGKVDRFDTYDKGDLEYIKVIDYKTNANTKYELTKNYYGLSMQLPLYLKALTGENKLPAGAFYFSVANPNIEIKTTKDLEEIEKLIEDNLKLDGILLNDIDILNNMDTNLENSYMKVSLKKDGSIKKTSNVFTKEGLDLILEHTYDKCIKLIQDIKNLKIDINPYEYSNKMACEHCNYKSICKFEKIFNNTNKIKTIRKNDFFNKKGEENGVDKQSKRSDKHKK